MKAIQLRTFNLIVNLLAALIMVTAVIVSADTAPGHAQAASPIEVLEQSTQSDFGKTMTFSVKVRSSAGKIVSARLYRRLPNQTYDLVSPVKVSEAEETTATFVWNTKLETIPPWLIIRYQWELKDSAGNLFMSEPVNAIAADDTRPWKNHSDGKVAVYYYNQNERFGKDLFASAQQGFQLIQKATGHTPAYEIRVVLFNNQADFCSFHAPNQCLKWAGGLTFPGLTAQWINTARDPSRRFLLREAIPHELAHAFLHEWVKPGLGEIPSWFDEGQALNNQIAGLDKYLQRARQLARTDKLRRISAMGAVGYMRTTDDQKVIDWYSQAGSLVAYLYQRWGKESLGKVISNMNDGDTFEAAWKKVTGLTLEEYEVEWRKWVGATKPMPTLLPTATTIPLPGS
jgi:hypothetical protein